MPDYLCFITYRPIGMLNACSLLEPWLHCLFLAFLSVKKATSLKLFSASRETRIVLWQCFVMPCHEDDLKRQADVESFDGRSLQFLSWALLRPYWATLLGMWEAPGTNAASFLSKQDVFFLCGDRINLVKKKQKSLGIICSFRLKYHETTGFFRRTHLSQLHFGWLSCYWHLQVALSNCKGQRFLMK